MRTDTMKALAPAKVELRITPNTPGVVEHEGHKFHVVDFYYREFFDLERMTEYPEIYERTWRVMEVFRNAYAEMFGPLLVMDVGRLENGFFIKGTTTSAGILGMIQSSTDTVGLDLFEVRIRDHIEAFKEQTGVDIGPTVDEIVDITKEMFREEE